MKKKSQKQEEEQFEEKAKPLSSLLFILLLCSGLFTQASTRFDLNSELLKAQKYTYQLQLSSARVIITSEREKNPNNAAAAYLEHFGNVLELFVTEDPTNYKTYYESYDQDLGLFEDLQDSEPFKRFVQAELMFYWAAVKGKSEEFYSAALDLNSAYKLLKQNKEDFPDFLPNNKTLGVVQSFLSTVPDQYTWAVNLLGLKADLDDGLKNLRSIAYAKGIPDEQKYIQQEAGYLYAYTLYHIDKDTAASWQALESFTRDYKSNLLSVYFRSSLAEKMQKNDVVIETISAAPKGSEYIKFYYLNYVLGEAKLNRLDVDADQYLLKFYSNFKGSNYIKSSLQRLSWHYLIHGDEKQYIKYKNLIKEKGKALNEDDKLALLYADKSKPNIDLLKTRLLFDGGYYKKAFAIIHPMGVKDFGNYIEKAEYAYRKARVYEALGLDQIASKFYEFATVFGINSPEYYAAYSCLHLADQAMKNENCVEARSWYQKSMEYKSNKEYINSIEQRAKQGLKSCK
ncbi:hypothetical protein GYB22_03815 [bacterium]|nr:hypothetical protein [bacterium]